MRLAASFFAILAFATTPGIAQQGLLPQNGAPPGTLRALSTFDDAAGWEAVGRIDTQVSFCSGTLIAPDLVLTAAHCLYDEGGARLPVADITFAASLRNDRAEAIRRVRGAVLHPAYPGPNAPDQAAAIALDIAILELARPVAAQTVRPIPTGGRPQERDSVTVVSYGARREAYASIEEGCTVLAREGAILILDCDAVSGSSGAPILGVTEDGFEVLALVSASAEWQGSAVAVGVAVDGLLPDLLALRSSQTGRARLPGAVRSLEPGQSGREGIGARFIRP